MYIIENSGKLADVLFVPNKQTTSEIKSCSLSPSDWVELMSLMTKHLDSGQAADQVSHA